MYLGPNCKNVEFGGSKIIITPIDYKAKWKNNDFWAFSTWNRHQIKPNLPLHRCITHKIEDCIASDHTKVNKIAFTPFAINKLHINVKKYTFGGFWGF